MVIYRKFIPHDVCVLDVLIIQACPIVFAITDFDRWLQQRIGQAITGLNADLNFVDISWIPGEQSIC